MRKECKYAGDGLKMAIEIIEYYNNQSPMYMYIFIALIASCFRVILTVYYSEFWNGS